MSDVQSFGDYLKDKGLKRLLIWFNSVIHDDVLSAGKGPIVLPSGKMINPILSPENNARHVIDLSYLELMHPALVEAEQYIADHPKIVLGAMYMAMLCSYTRALRWHTPLNRAAETLEESHRQMHDDFMADNKRKIDNIVDNLRMLNGFPDSPQTKILADKYFESMYDEQYNAMYAGPCLDLG